MTRNWLIAPALLMSIGLLLAADEGNNTNPFLCYSDPAGKSLIETRESCSSAGVTYHLAVSKRGGHLCFSVDGKVLLEAADPHPRQGGQLGLRTFRTDLWWDNIKMTAVSRK